MRGTVWIAGGGLGAALVATWNIVVMVRCQPTPRPTTADRADDDHVVGARHGLLRELAPDGDAAKKRPRLIRTRMMEPRTTASRASAFTAMVRFERRKDDARG